MSDCIVDILDTEFRDTPRATAAYLIETDDGPGLFDCGPATTLATIRKALSEHGLALTDLRHLLLSHIHFDHAGAAGAIVAENPELQVWVSPVGAPHLVDPSRLEASARRLYGDDFDTLWGGLTPIPQANIRIAEGTVAGWEAFPTPGHARHHVSYLRGGAILAGDVCGLREPGTEYVLPAAPPPDIDVEAWHASLDAIEQRSPERLALIHFGVATDPEWHIARLRAELDAWSALVRDGADQQAFIELVRPTYAADAPEYFDPVDSFGQSWQGLSRYWTKRREREQAAEPG